MPGETISLHTSDKIKVLKVSTNVLWNVGVRLASEGFDVNALRYEEMSLASLLPDQNIYNRYNFKVITKYRNRELGYTDWEIQPFAEDWLDKANKTIKNDQKIAILEQAVRALPEDTRVWRKLLDEYKAQKQWKQAAHMLEKEVEKNPSQDVLSELLEIYTAMSSDAKIRSVLNKLIALDPKNLNYQLQLAEILEQSKKYRDAIRQYERLLKQVGSKEKLNIYERLGYLYSKTGGYKSAISNYLSATRLNSKDANLYYNLSFLYEKTDQTQKSYEALEKAVSLNPKDMDSRLVLAQRFVETGDFKRADKYLDQILNKNPSHPKALLLKATVLEKQGKKKELAKIYKKIYSLNPKNDTVLYNLGALSYESGDLTSSLDYLLKYVKKNPKDVAAQEIIYDIYRKQRDDKRAFEAAQRIVKLKPKSREPYYFIFDYLNKRKEFGAMIPIMEQAVKSNPDEIGFREQLLYAYLKTGKEDSALTQMDQLLALRPKDTGLWLQKARLLEKRNKPTDAMNAYKKVLSISPDNEEASEAYLRLRLEGGAR